MTEKVVIEFEVRDAGKVTREIRSVEQSLQKVGERFKFEYLGTLFFGQQMQRLFGGIARSGVDSFRSITEATEGGSSALTMMAASTEYLKFTLGDALATALEPLLPTLLNIVDALANWIEQNPKLASGVLIGGFAIGTFLNTASQLLLVFGSLKLILGAGTGAGIVGSFGSLGGIFAIMSNPLALIIIGLGALLILFGDLKPIWNEMGKIAGLFVDILKELGIDVDDVIAALKFLAEIVGGVVLGALRAVAAVLEVILFALKAIKDLFSSPGGQFALSYIQNPAGTMSDILFNEGYRRELADRIRSDYELINSGPSGGSPTSRPQAVNITVT